MFILVYFGYKQYKIFCIDCLTASLLDYIWKLCKQEMEKLLVLREDIHNKETVNIQKKVQKLDQRLEKVDLQLKEEEEKKKKEEEGKQQQEGAPKDGKASKKDVKQTKKPGKKEDIIPSNPLEAEKLEIVTELDKCRKALEAYSSKLEKLTAEKTRLANLGDIHLELVDTVGERKYIKSKLQQQANEFLADKGSYRLSRITPDPAGGPEENVELILLDGSAIRTVEEDEKYVEEPQLILKGKDSKKAAKKK